MGTYSLGYKPSPVDERDYRLSQLISCAPRLPEEYINPTPLHIFDQGNTCSCVACSAAQGKHLLEYRQTDDDQPFSPMYLYGHRQEGDYLGAGYIPREAWKNLKAFGMCHWDDFDGFYEYPEARTRYHKNETSLDAKAYPYRISSYYRLKSKKDIQTAILTIGFAMVAYYVQEPMYYPDKDGIVQYDPTIPEDPEAGHQMIAVGYNREGLIVCNSWGINYGIGFKENHTEGGLMIVPYDYPVSEAWAIIDDISEKFTKEIYKE